MTRPFFLAIEGPIGVGKTTLARLLEPRFEAGLLLEAFAENPFLSEFYADRARYAFQTQMFFLLSRYRQQQSVPLLLERAPLIADYTFGKDSLFAHLNLEHAELKMYERVYGVLADRVLAPNLVIYLRADTDTLMVRIATRDRAYEREMDRVYIESVRRAYERHFSSYTRAPVMTVNTNDLNYIRNSGALAFIGRQVRAALGEGSYQQALPRMESVGPVRMPAPLTETTDTVWGADAMVEFLAADEAMVRMRAALADGTARRSRKARMELRTALEETVARLQRLAAAAGVELQETQELQIG